MSTPSAEGQPLPDGTPDEVEQVEVTEPTPPADGLVPLGSPDGVVCEDGVCSVPPAFS